MQQLLLKRNTITIVFAVLILCFFCACSNADTNRTSEAESQTISCLPSVADLIEHYPKQNFSKKIDINNNISSLYVNWDSINISDYNFGDFFERFGKPDFKLLICPLDEYNQTNVEWEELPSHSAPPIVKSLFSENPGIRCIEYDWNYVEDTNYKLSVYVIECTDGLYPIYGELTHLVVRSDSMLIPVKVSSDVPSLELMDTGYYDSLNISGITLIEAKNKFGKDPDIEKIDYEHCFLNNNDTLRPFYNYYMKYPYKDFYKAIWTNFDNKNNTLTLYLSQTLYSNDAYPQVFWGYRCRPEDFTTDIYKVE